MGKGYNKTKFYLTNIMDQYYKPKKYKAKKKFGIFRDYHRRQHSFQPTEELKQIPRQTSKTQTKADLKSWRRRIITSIAGIVFLYFVYVLIFSSYLQITQVNINGASDEINAELQSIVNNYLTGNKLAIIPKNNIVFLSSNNLIKNIEKEIVFIKIEIDKNFPHQLQIKVEESQYVFTLDFEGHYYYVNAEGLVAKEIFEEEIQEGMIKLEIEQEIISEAELNKLNKESEVEEENELSAGDSGESTKEELIAKLTNQNTDEPEEKFEININYPLLTSQQVTKMLEYQNEINNTPQVEIASFIYNPDTFDQFKVKTIKDWEIILLYDSDAKNKVYNLNELIKQKIGEGNNVQYIDLRYDKWMYYQ